MKIEEILQLVDSVSNSALAEFKYEEGGVKLSLKKAAAQGVYSEEVSTSDRGIVQNAGQQTVIKAEVTDASVGQKPKTDGKIVKSPLVGTFYTAPSEDASPFVSVGDSVKEGQILAIVEAMKLMNEIESEYDGIVEEILVQNGDAVEYGQPLFVIS